MGGHDSTTSEATSQNRGQKDEKKEKRGRIGSAWVVFGAKSSVHYGHCNQLRPLLRPLFASTSHARGGTPSPVIAGWYEKEEKEEKEGKRPWGVSFGEKRREGTDKRERGKNGKMGKW